MSYPVDIEGTHVDPPARITSAGDTELGPDGGPGGSGGTPQTPPAFTKEQIENARKQERDKVQAEKARLKAQADQLKAELDQIKAQQAEIDKQRQAEEKRLAKKAKTEAEKDLSAKEVLARREAEWEAERERERLEMEGKIAAQERAMQQKFAQFDLERQHMQLQGYIQQRVAQEQLAKTIAPQLIDYITGTTPEEVEASIELAKAKTAEIQAEVTEGLKSQRQFSGVSLATGPNAGMTHTEMQADAEPDYTTMSYADYVKNRPKLIVSKGEQGIFS